MLTLLFLPALYLAWFRIRPPEKEDEAIVAGAKAPVPGDVVLV